MLFLISETIYLELNKIKGGLWMQDILLTILGIICVILGFKSYKDGSGFYAFYIPTGIIILVVQITFIFFNPF